MPPAPAAAPAAAMSALHPLSLFLLLLLLSSPLPPPPAVSAEDLLFNGFDTGSLTLYGHATIEQGHRSLSLTNSSAFSIGRALYKSKVATRTAANSSSPSSDARRVLPFHASFIFSIAPIPDTLPGHGFAFLFSPSPGIQGATAAEHLGLFNRTTDGDRANRVLAVEFDVFQNEEFNDIDANHVGVDLYSLTSVDSHTAGYWPDGSSSFVDLKLNDGSNYQAWVDYADGRLNVTMAPATVGRKPGRPLISKDLDLSDVFLDEMYVGFCSATGMLVERHRILGWSFSNYNTSTSEGLDTSHLPNFVPPLEGRKLGKGAIAAIVAASVAVFTITSVSLLVFWRHRRLKKREETGGPGGDGGEEVPEDWELEYWPHRIAYRDISDATDAFSDRNLIGCGGNGRVYKGVLGGAQVAIKLFLRNTGEEARQFLAEVSSLGRLKHRNLVGLRGWCRRKEGGDLILVYDYMENGSLDKRIFSGSVGAEPLDWETRVRALRDVAAAVLYLHEGWEAKVLHRDIKASNVMLDSAMNGRLGDFGLARMHAHGRGLSTSRVVGSVGYMAPEVVRSGRASAATDVYGFGVLLLEVVCGRRPVEKGCLPLVEWVWTLAEREEEVDAVDPQVRGVSGGSFDEGEAVRLLQLGLMCTCVEPASRPTMRQVARTLEGPAEAESADCSNEKGGSEAAEAWLLDRKLRGADAMAPTTAAWMWSKRPQGKWSMSRSGSAAAQQHHPTFEQLRQSTYCSTSLSVSDVIVEGR